MTSFRTIAITGAAVVGYCLAVAFGPAFLFGTTGNESLSLQAYASSSTGSPSAADCKNCVEAASR